MKVERLDVTGVGDLVVRAEDFDRVEAERDALQALLNERDAELDRLNPQWHSMRVEPPFPFSGDICLAGGLVRQQADWCATYWTHRGRILSRDEVLAWRRSPELSGPSL